MVRTVSQAFEVIFNSYFHKDLYSPICLDAPEDRGRTSGTAGAGRVSARFLRNF